MAGYEEVGVDLSIVSVECMLLCLGREGGWQYLKAKSEKAHHACSGFVA